MSEKRVVAVIVEGPSDESAIGGILKDYYASDEVRFAVVRGDITTNNNVNSSNVVNKINFLIDGIRKKYGYSWGDFLSIIHITDTDGVFVKGNAQETETDHILYYEDHFECPSIAELEQRNRKKSEILYKLSVTPDVHRIPYRIYYLSCNLEHVLHGELKDFSDEEKELLSDEFSDKYEGKLQEFITFISDETIAVPGNYKKTWDFIGKDKNSLHRHSNMHLIFQDDSTSA